MAGEDWTFWLNMTNLALGVITVLALLVVGAAIGWELCARKQHKPNAMDNIDQELRTMLELESHRLSMSEWGTPTDVGEPVDAEPQLSHHHQHRK